MRNLRILNLILAFFCSFSLMAQNLAVSGKVITITGEPIIGATVVVEGQANGVITDYDGKFTLLTNKGDVLNISFIGFKSQTYVVRKAVRDIVIRLDEDNVAIDEVVVVGTSMKKSDLTGSVVGVSSKVLSEKPVTSVNEALQGRVAGVHINQPSSPTGEASIKIRGINTINGSTDPIYVVDGLVMDNSFSGFSSINLNDVASIEVLKDASATALYGSRGSNGVVVITTKKGSLNKGKVSYNGWVGIQSFAKTPETMDTRELFELRKEAYVNGFKQVNPDGNVDEYIQNIVMGSNQVFADYEFEAYKNNKNYDWLDEVTRTGIQHNHNISFSNASEKGNFYLSFGYSDKKGVLKNSESEMLSGRINADYSIKPWLKVGTNTSFTRMNRSDPSGTVLPYARGANPMLPISSEIETLNWQGIFDQNSFNPIRSLSIQQDRINNRLTSSNYININPLEGLNLRSTFSLDYASHQWNQYIPSNIYESIRESTDGQANDNRDVRTVVQWDNTISYDTTIGKNRLHAMFGNSITKTEYNNIGSQATGFSNNYLGYHNLGAGYKQDRRLLSTFWNNQALASFILRLNYNYDSRYLLTATARFDGSSKFTKGNRWGIFPSVSAAWNIIEEEFMENQNIFDNLKLRLGYGVVGNQNILDYAYLSLYNPVSTGNMTDGYSNQFISDGRRGTPDITWERQKQFNVGLDVSVLNNRLNVSLDGFVIKNDNLLMTHALPATTGYSTTIENIGAIENKGIEFSLNANLINTKDFDWNFSATISKDKNKITSLYGNNNVIYNTDKDRHIQNQGNLFLGHSRNTIYMYKTGGIAQKEDMDRLNQIDWSGRQVSPGDIYPLDIDDNHLIDQNDRIIIGSTDPKFYGGFTTDMSWKGLKLNAVFTYSYGAKGFSGRYNQLVTSSGSGVASTELRDRWTPENTTAKYPRVITGVDYSHYSVVDMDYCVNNLSFLRLSTLSLSYDFPARILQKMRFSNFRVYFTGSNLFCATKYKGDDPEMGDGYPPTRMYTFGVNFSF